MAEDHPTSVAFLASYLPAGRPFSQASTSSQRYRMAPFRPRPTTTGWIPASFIQRLTEDRWASTISASVFRLTSRHFGVVFCFRHMLTIVDSLPASRKRRLQDVRWLHDDRIRGRSGCKKVLAPSAPLRYAKSQMRNQREPVCAVIHFQQARPLCGVGLTVAECSEIGARHEEHVRIRTIA